MIELSVTENRAMRAMLEFTFNLMDNEELIKLREQVVYLMGLKKGSEYTDEQWKSGEVWQSADDWEGCEELFEIVKSQIDLYEKYFTLDTE